MKGNIFDIQRNSFADGPGIRTTVFFKGCNLRCAWCHNPEGQSAQTQMMFFKNKCIGCGKCREVCPHGLASCEFCGQCTLYCPVSAREISGKYYSSEELLRIIQKDRIFYDCSGGGVTFSGGECMLQIDFLAEILKKCKESGIRTAVDTAGHLPWSSFKKILPYTDLFLYDVKIMDSALHQKYTGAGNELLLENLSRLLEQGFPVWTRTPLIPGINDDEENFRVMRRFFREHGQPQKSEILPYHAMGEHKYAALGLQAETFTVPEKEKVEALAAFLKE